MPPRITRRRRSVHYSRDQLLELVRKAEKYGEGNSLSEFTRETGVSPKPIIRLFDGWVKLKHAAGLRKIRQGGQPTQFTREELIERLREIVSRRVDISRNQFCRELKLSTNGLIGVISWGELRKAIGLPTRVRGGRTTWDDELLAQIPETPVDLFAGLNLDD
ncbi:MAG: hypothetical protein KDA75_22750, partial [Planctomycetaceae bacterium]|nr:hypothetical protein [Planctomycetaceae bacterium]